MTNYCLLWLTCKDGQEADKISDTLLVKHLAACVKQFSVKSSFHWKNKVESSDEVLLMMESRLDLFDKVEAEVRKIHSYETFVLNATPIAKISKKAAVWLEEETNG